MPCARSGARCLSTAAHLADDSVEQVRGYYQTGALYALDDQDGTPIGVILAATDPAAAQSN